MYLALTISDKYLIESVPDSFFDNFDRSISSSFFSILHNITSPYSVLSFSARSIETLAPSATSLVTFSQPIGITLE